MEHVKKILYFDKESGNYQGIIESEELLKGLNRDLFVTKEVEMGPGEYWLGDYETGQKFNRNEVPMVFEEDLYRQTYESILQSYPLYKQISILSELIEKNSAIAKTREFEDMIAFINSQKLRLKHKIKHMSSDPKAFNFIRRKTDDQNNMRPGQSA